MLAPLYIAEVSPAAIRGRLVSLNQLAIVIGILVSYLVGWQLASLGDESWRWMFAVAAIPSLLFFGALFSVPESPRWLVKEGRRAEAEKILARLGEPPSQIIEIERTIAEESGSFRQLFEKGLRRPLAIGIVLAILQQVTGINTVLFYGSIIFTEHAGPSSTSAALWANVLVGAINLVFTVVALFTIDRLGRKVLLISAAGGMCLSLTVLGVVFNAGALSPARAAAVDPLLRSVLRLRHGTRRVGGDVGTLPDAHSRTRDVAGYHRALACLPVAHRHVPFAGEGIHRRRRVSHLRRPLRHYRPVCLEIHARNQG